MSDTTTKTLDAEGLAKVLEAMSSPVDMETMAALIDAFTR